MTHTNAQLRLPDVDPGPTRHPDDRVHDWYRFVLGFPPSLVRDYLAKLDLTPGQRVMDPFSGTGTTLVECKKASIASVGVEANPLAQFASRVKLDWSLPPTQLREYAEAVAQSARSRLDADGLPHPPAEDAPCDAHPSLRSLPEERQRLLLGDSISPLPLHRTLALLDFIRRVDDAACETHGLLALAKILPTQVGNLRFGPEVGVGCVKEDSPVVDLWLEQMGRVSDDLEALPSPAGAEAISLRGDARDIGREVEDESVHGVITSPPYPNEKDYTRTCRLESVILGFVSDRNDLRAVKQGLLRSNTRGVYKHDSDHRWASQFPEVQRIADEIEARRIELGKTSGFERQYARVTRLYFGGMARHFAGLRRTLRPGARLAYVVGDQASYLRVMIRTGQLLAQIAESLGYEVLGIDLFRTRMATATKARLREEVLLLRWPGA